MIEEILENVKKTMSVCALLVKFGSCTFDIAGKSQYTYVHCL